MDVLKSTLRKLFHLAIVPRWVIVEMERPQTVAEHTFKVMALVEYIGTRIQEIFGINLDWSHLYEEAMYHDIDEALSGDIPAPFKKKYLSGHGLGPACEPMAMPEEESDYLIENSIIVIADLLEAYIYAYKYQKNHNNITDGKEDECTSNLRLGLLDSYNEKLDIFIKYLDNEGHEGYKIRSICEEVFFLKSV